MSAVLYFTMQLLSKLPSAQNLHPAGALVSHYSVSKADEEIRFALRPYGVFTWGGEPNNQIPPNKKADYPTSNIRNAAHPPL